MSDKPGASFLPAAAILTLLFALLTLMAAPAAAQHKALDPTVGGCTRKDEFAKRQAALDPRIVELSQAEDEAAQVELGAKIAEEFGKGQRIENLIRYREPALRRVFLPLLEAESWAIRQRALYGLKMVGDESIAPQIAKAMQDENPQVREMAVNALCHLLKTDASLLEARLAEGPDQEKDIWVRRSLEAALAVVKSGKKPYAPWKEKLVGPQGARRVEWAWTVKGKNSFNRYDARTLEYPRAKDFDWPISLYDGSLFMKTPRSSFGANGTHAGEDMAWFREGASVYAVADGIVRLIQGAGGNWGFFLLIEHRLENGDYKSSIYGHLGWDILVAPGDIVRKGQKLATVGLSCAVENGGYGSHLHFGIGDGPFRRAPRVLRGATLNLNRGEEKIQAKVLGFAYDASRKDQHGFPALAIRVAMGQDEEGQPIERALPVNAGHISGQVRWITGYAKGCRGWLDPRVFIGERR
jgi:murein DD-endopeptidase MepM/ murein hydrolase activator NlpD